MVGVGNQRTTLAGLNQFANTMSNIVQGDRQLDQRDVALEQSQQRLDMAESALEVQHQAMAEDRKRADEERVASAEMWGQILGELAPKQPTYRPEVGPMPAASTIAGLVTNPGRAGRAGGLGGADMAYGAIAERLKHMDPRTQAQFGPMLQQIMGERQEAAQLETLRASLNDHMALAELGPPSVRDQLLMGPAQSIAQGIDSGALSFQEAAGLWSQELMEVHERVSDWKFAESWYLGEEAKNKTLLENDRQARGVLEAVREALENGVPQHQAIAPWLLHVNGEEAIQAAAGQAQLAQAQKMEARASEYADRFMADPMSMATLGQMFPEMVDEKGNLKKGATLRDVRSALIQSHMVQSAMAQAMAMPRQPSRMGGQPESGADGSEAPQGGADSGVDSRLQSLADEPTEAPSDDRGDAGVVVDTAAQQLTGKMDPRNQIPGRAQAVMARNLGGKISEMAPELGATASLGASTGVALAKAVEENRDKIPGEVLKLLERLLFGGE